jgi:hypothetical protein
VNRYKSLFKESELSPKQFWYHITIDNWPNTIILTPRKGGQNLGAEEGK